MSGRTDHPSEDAVSSSSKGKEKVPRHSEGAYNELQLELNHASSPPDEVQEFADYLSHLSLDATNDPSSTTNNPSATSQLATSRVAESILSKFGGGPLIAPVLIPQENGRGWMSAYASLLQDASIEEPDFLRFLDILNQTISTLTYLDVINVAAINLISAFDLPDTVIQSAKCSAMDIPYLVYQTNATFFAARGIYMTFVTYDKFSTSLVLRLPLPHQPLNPTSPFTPPFNILVELLQPADLTLPTASGAYEGSSSGPMGYGSQGYVDLRSTIPEGIYLLLASDSTANPHTDDLDQEYVGDVPFLQYFDLQL